LHRRNNSCARERNRSALDSRARKGTDSTGSRDRTAACDCRRSLTVNDRQGSKSGCFGSYQPYPFRPSVSEEAVNASTDRHQGNGTRSLLRQALSPWAVSRSLPIDVRRPDTSARRRASADRDARSQRRRRAACTPDRLGRCACGQSQGESLRL
jgi:hypothetical protein